MNSGMGSRIPDAARSASEFGIPFLLVVYLAFASGGYDLVVRSQIGIIVWWAVLLGILAGILPVARITRAGFTMFVIVAMLFLWTAISTLFWTESAERSVIEVTRVATLLGTFVLLVLVQGKSGIRHGVTAIAAAVALISVVSLGDRLLPNLVPFGADYVLPADYPRARLNYPLEYWNGLATLVAMGIGPLLWIASSARTTAGRAVAAGILPVVALVGYLTASRGGVVEVAFVLLVMFILFPNRLKLLLNMAIPVAGSVLLVVLVNRRPELRDFFPGDAAKTQGEQMAYLTLGVFLLAATAQTAVLVAARKRGLKAPRPSHSSARNTGVIVGVLSVLALAVALASGFVGDRWSEFQQPQSGETVNRLNNLNSGERYQNWEAALDAAASEKLTGIGPGTFEYWWAREGQGLQFVRDAHSIYLESLAETGPIGFLLVLALVLVPIGLAIRLASQRHLDEERGLIAAAAAGMVAFAVAAGIDWAWELTVLPVVFLSLAAAIVGFQYGPGPKDDPLPKYFDSWKARTPAAVISAFMIALIAIPMAATLHYRESQDAVVAGDLERALDQAREASSLQPYSASAKVQEAQVLGLLGKDEEASNVAREATEEEPGNWRNWLVLSQILEQIDPAESKSAYAKARQLNPKSNL